MAGNTYGRQVVEALVNKTGGAVVAGDVVIIDTANDGAFTTTTTARSEVTIGVVQETIASNATGRVLLSGFAALVNVPASVTRGHYVETHTVAKQATGNSTRRSGSFGQFRTGGTTPTAVIWGNSDQTVTAAASLTVEEVDGSPTDSAVTKIVFPNSTLAIASHVATYTPSGGGSALASASAYRTSGDYTTSSSTFVDVDSTNMSLTITTGAHRVMIAVVGSVTHSTANSYSQFDVAVDSTRLGGSGGLLRVQNPSAILPMTFTYITDALSAASHTFKLQWMTSNATATLFAGSILSLRFAVVELNT